MSILTDFETWKAFLGDRVNEAKKAGMSEKPSPISLMKSASFSTRKSIRKHGRAGAERALGCRRRRGAPLHRPAHGEMGRKGL